MDVESKVVNTEENTSVTEPKKIKRDYVPHRRVSIRICKECGRMYVLPDKDAVYFVQNFSNLPLRCEECRKRQKETTETSVVEENK